MNKKVRPSVREHHAKMLREIDDLMELAEYGCESNEAITVYYQPIESAARNIAESDIRVTDLGNGKRGIVIDEVLFNTLLDALQISKIGEENEMGF